MKVEFYRHQLREANLNRFAQVMNTIFLTTGDEVALFEQKFADFLGEKYIIGLTSVTAGLQLSLLALGIEAHHTYDIRGRAALYHACQCHPDVR